MKTIFTILKVLARRKFILFAVVFSFLFAFVEPLAADVGRPGLIPWQKSVFDPGVFDKRAFDNSAWRNFELSVFNALAGCIDRIGNTQIYDQCPKNESGAIGTTSTLIASLYNPPASSVEYLAYVGKNLGIIQPAYAQTGTGFQGLLPILDLWRVFRNIAYIGFVIVFVVTGLAIMFRVRLSPQTVITIQSSLPRVVVALLLVTFSYAIAGLLIDLSYVIFLLLINVMQSMRGIDAVEADAFRDDYLQGGFLQTIGALISRGSGVLRDILGGLLPRIPL